jgi:signal transduction histidine kinase
MNRELAIIDIIKNIFTNRIYRLMLIGSLIAAVLLPILAQQIVVPSFYKQMLENTLADAKKVGTHIARHQNHDVSSTVFYTALDKLKDDFEIIKIRLFDQNGKIVFSTKTSEIGNINEKSYYKDIVAKGKMYYKIVQKGANSSEGDSVLNDVAEIYVPIMKEGVFKGSSEIYYDITKKKESFKELMIKVNLIYYAFAFLFIIFVLFMLYNASAVNLREYLVDQELKELNSSLKEKVDQKTRALQDINKNLENRVNEEIEKNRKKDSRLFQQSKLASMGEMIGNIAHQWRQPLSAISSTVSSMKLQKELGILEEKEIEKGFDKISSTTEYLSNTINDFRDFFQSDKKKTTTNINNIIKSTLSILSSTIKNNEIKIVQNIDNTELTTLPNEFQQSLLNIINNATDILQEKNPKEKYIFLESKKIEKENKVEITILDNAGGIKEDIIEKIFEPYFTTKHQSQGTGIGLYMTQEIIKKHLQGNIKVSNHKFEYNGEQYKGALFEITVPLQ